MTARAIQRRRLLTAAGGMFAASAVLSRVAQSSDGGPPDPREQPHSCGLNVCDYGAVGDGKHDNTLAFQKALDTCASRGGGVVHVPTGQYLIKGHLAIPPAVCLEGVFRAPPSYRPQITADGDVGKGTLYGSVLLAVEGAGEPQSVPFITLSTNSTLKGVTIFYPQQKHTNPPVAYPWTVAVASGGAADPAIIDVLMVNPYQAVDFGSYPSGRLLIRNLYADAIYRGIYIDNCTDVGRVENAHLYQFWQPGNDNAPQETFTFKNGQAFIVGRVDTLQLINCFAIAYKYGFRFTKASPTGITRAGPSADIAAQIKEADYSAGSATITGGGIDESDTAVLVEDSYAVVGLSFVNCSFSGYIRIRPTNRGMVHFTACNIIGIGLRQPDAPIIESAGEGRVSFVNCIINDYAPYRKRKRTTILHAINGGFRLIGCTISSAVTGTPNLVKPAMGCEQEILIEPDVRAAIITSNDFSGKAVIGNASKGKVLAANNIEETG